MALAFIACEDSNGTEARFRIDIGTNRWYAYAIGSGAAKGNGLPMLRDRSFTSELHGPLEESLRGRTVLSVPGHLFDRQHRDIQLLSFREEDGLGPAVSEVVRVPLVSASDDVLPPLSFSRGAVMNRLPVRRGTDSVACSMREARPVSRAFFLQALLPLIPQILPAVAPFLSGLLRGGNSPQAPAQQPPAGGSAQAPAQQPAGSGKTMELLMQLLQQLAAAQKGTSTTQQAQSDEQSVYSNAMVFPIAAVAAALPALMPLLQQLLNPQTIQAIGSVVDPSKLISTVTQGLQGLAGLGLEADKAQMEHLRAIHPDINDPALIGLLQSMSASIAETKKKQIPFRRIDSVRLQFADVTPQLIGGRTRIAYRRDADVSFPLTVKTPRPITRAVLQTMFKDAATGRLLFESRQKIERAETGRLPVAPLIPAHRIGELAAGEDYLVCVSLTWKGRDGKRLGTSIMQMITLVDELTFDRAAGEGEVIPLNDVQRFRDFWHKAWAGTFSQERRRVMFDCRYYYAFDPARDRNARMETQSRFAKDGTTSNADAKLRTGVLLSADALNALTPSISAYPMLGPNELAALRTNDFAKQFHQAARFRVKMRGKPGQAAALWIYPEVRMHRLTLRKAVTVNAAGHVLEFAEQAGWLPMPVLAHFIGTETER